MAPLFIASLDRPGKSDRLLLRRILIILTGPIPTKIAWKDLDKATIWRHEVVIDQASPMHAYLEQGNKERLESIYGLILQSSWQNLPIHRQSATF